MYVVLGLGSNKGNSRSILKQAVGRLQEALSALRAASLFETEPLYVTDQNWFLNTAVSGLYKGRPHTLLETIHRIEADFGRDRMKERRFGERTLDIDILLFGDVVLSEPLLEIPHPRLRERAFALVPLLELLPDARDPITGESYRSILHKISMQGIRYVESPYL